MSALEVRRRDHPPGGFLAGRRPPGECQLKFDDDGILIERADEHVWLEDTFLRRLVMAQQGRAAPAVTLAYQPHDLCEPLSCCQRQRAGHCFYGAVVTIWGKNAHVSYRIGQFRRGHWEAEWA